MNTTDLLRVGRASDLSPAGFTAGRALFLGDFVAHEQNDTGAQTLGIDCAQRFPAIHPSEGVASTGETMNNDDQRGPINPHRELSGHLPADIAKPLQQAVHEWPKASKWHRVHQLECEAVRRGLRVPDALMGFGRSA